MDTSQIVKPKDQTVTFIELFFDLVFVFSITQIVELLHHDFTWLTVGEVVLVFWLIWWAWTQFSWSLNSADTETVFVELSVLAATGVIFFMAVGVPQAFGAGALWFAIPYLVVRAIGNLVSFVVSGDDPSFRAGVRSWILMSLSGGAAVVIGALLGGTAQFWLWGLAIFLDIYAAYTTGRSGEYEFHISPAHFSERHGLFVIIVLGETLILAASGVSTDTQWTGELLGVAVLAVAITGGLWWSYFTHAAPALEHALASNEGAKQSRIAVDSYSILHFVMLGGIIAYAAAIEQAISHPDHALPVAETWAFALGVFLFVSGMAVAEWRGTGSLRWPRVVISVVMGAAIVMSMGGSLTLTMGIALLGVVVINVVER